MSLPVLTREQQESRLNAIKDIALEVEKTFGFPAPLLGAQYALESYFGLGDELPVEMNNFFGQKAIAPDPWATGKRDVPSKEWTGTEWKLVTSSFYVYPDLRASAMAHGFYCTGGDLSIHGAEVHWAWARYRKNRPTSLDPMEWARWLQSGIPDPITKVIGNPGGPAYATDPAYTGKLQSIIDKFNLWSWVQPPPKPEKPQVEATTVLSENLEKAGTLSSEIATYFSTRRNGIRKTILATIDELNKLIVTMKGV